MSNLILSKKCSKCNVEKLLSEFYVQKAGKYGVMGMCKSCNDVRTREYRLANPEKSRKYTKAYRLANPEKAAAQVRAYRLANPEKVTAAARTYRLANPEKGRSNTRNWALANPEAHHKRVRDWEKLNPVARGAIRRNYRALKKSATGTHTKSDIYRILMLQTHKCPVCKTELTNNYHVDHITPLSRGGSNDPNNLQLLCVPCNLKKHAKDPIDFMQENGFLL